MKVTDKITLGKDEEFVINGNKTMTLKEGDTIEIRKKEIAPPTLRCPVCNSPIHANKQGYLNGHSYMSVKTTWTYLHHCQYMVDGKIFRTQIHSEAQS